jgi:itaconyl-CoA hydratase
VTRAGQQRGWWLEDAIVGGIIVHPGGRTVSADEHPRLAWLTDNASDVHGDAHRAAARPFGAPLVLGALTAAVVIGLAEPAVGPVDAAARARPTGWARIDLTGIVLAGDTLSATSTVEAVAPDPDARGGLVRRVVEGRNQRGSIVVRIADERWAPARDRRG